MNSTIDGISLNFSQGSLLFLNLILGLIMFGVALELKIEHFKLLFRNSKSPLVGIFSQFILLPLFTFLLILAIKPHPSLALGMILVAACPGGNISNFLEATRMFFGVEGHHARRRCDEDIFTLFQRR